MRVPVLARVRSRPHVEAEVRAIGLQLTREPGGAWAELVLPADVDPDRPVVGRMVTRDAQEVVLGEIGRVVEAELDVM